MHVSGNQLRRATLSGLALLLLTLTIIACGSDPAEEKVEPASTEMSNSTTVSEEPIAQLSSAATAPTNHPVGSTSKKNPVRKVSHTTPKSEPFAQLYRALEKPSERFSVPATKDTTITCAEGTTVKVKAGSFVSARTGKPVTGDVEIEVKEFYQTSDILGANLTTTSGGKMLETGGMLYIGASHDGEECRLNESSSIELGFPYEAARKSGMELFTGEWGENGVEWVPIRVSSSLQVEEIAKMPSELSPTYSNLANCPTRRITVIEGSPNTFDALYVEQVEIRPVSRYIFSTSQLGWINCDRFERDSRRKVDFVVDPGTSEQLDVKMIFHNIRSILPGTRVPGGYTFRNVPAGEEVTVVAVKSERNEYQVARESGTITEEGMESLKFEPATIERLRDVIEELGGATMR